MKVFIGDKDKLFKYDLPSSGTSFTISYRPLDFHEDILILFEFKNNSWYLNSSGSLNVVQNNNIVPSVQITDYSNFTLKYVANNITLVLYFLPDKEDYTKVNTLPVINIGNTSTSNINYNITANQMEYLTITSSNNTYSLKTCEGLPIYLNNELTKGGNLHIGDIIFINGFKLIFMGTFLLVNNPNNLIKVNGMTLYQDNNTPNNKYTDTTEEEKYIDLYSDKEYFSHTPRIREVIENEVINIDEPPQIGDEQKLPWYLTFGSSITIFVSMFIYLFNIINRLSAGASWINMIPQILMCISLLLASVLIPFLARRYQKNSRENYQKLALSKYNEYLAQVEKKLVEIEHKQRSILDNNALSIKRMLQTINNKDLNFWNRRITDDDFLQLRIGSGSVPVKVTVGAPEEHFSINQDELLHKVINLSKAHLVLEDAPITYSFSNNKITSIILNMPDPYKYINELLVQVFGLHSPIDLKIVVFTNKQNESKWDYIKYLSHNWSNDKSVRFFATDINEGKEISNYLSEKLNERVSNDKENGELAGGDANYQEPYKNYSTYYLIINDDYEIGKNIPIIMDLQKYEKNYGFSMVVFGKSLKKLPEKCPIFIQADHKHGAIISHLIQSDSQVKFNVETNELFDIKEYARNVSNVPVQVDEIDSVLPKSINFLEMFGVSRIEQLNVLNRWKTNNPVNSLRAQIGVHASGDPFYLDLHEKAHGPHGLIAGSTGSGKSEFIISYVLSMALNYDPREVQFVLIDYKGGGLAGAFENKETGLRIPHVIGTITNLDTNEINRALASVTSELERRQRIFNKTKDETGESTIDIYKYQKLFREGVVKEPLAHLFIVSDEFAELKKQQPEFMDELIQTARIGRSLGVHLILATQKPSGVVNDQIWSNSKFKVCLRVQDRGDSQEVLKRPDAASIKEAGRFYLQVGYDELFDIGQAGWAGARYHPSDKIIRNIDDSIELVSNTGESKRTIKEIVKVDTSQDIGDELTNLVKYICEVGNSANVKPLWLDALSPVIYIDNVKKKYNYQPKPYFINPVIGEYDSPENQLQNILNLNLTNQGNTLIYGSPGSGKENLLSTIIWSTVVEHVPQEVSMYIIDFGSGMLKVFNKIPHVGDIATIEEPDKIVDTFKMLDEEVQKRKELFADYGGSYVEYNENNEEKLPLIVTVINSYEVFQETMPKFVDVPTTLYRDGAKYGIIFIITCIQANTIRSRVQQNFNNIIALQMANDYDYRELVKAPKGLIPAKYFGRGLIKIEDYAYEFQTALIVERSQINNTIRNISPKLIEAYKGYKAPGVPTVPNVVTYDSLVGELKGLDKVPVGYDINKKAPITYDFKKNKYNLIAAPFMDDDKIFFVFALIKMLTAIENTEVIIFDLANAYSLNLPKVYCYKNDFDTKAGDVYKVVSTNKSKNYVIVFLGAGDIDNKIKGNNIKTLLRDKGENYRIILIDHMNSLKNIELDDWYQNFIDNSEGIWLGPEIASQLLISVNDISMDDRRINFLQMGFVIKDSKHFTMKHMLLMEGKDEK